MVRRRSQDEIWASNTMGCLGIGAFLLIGAVVNGIHELSRPLPSGLRVGDKQGSRREVGIPLAILPRHVHIDGPTGSGKTTLATRLLVQLMEQGVGLCVIDPKGGLIEDLLPHVPPHLFTKTILWDLEDTAYPFAFNLVEEVEEQQRTLAVSDALAVFQKLFAASWGHRQEWILRNCLLTLLEAPGSTLLDIPDLLLDEAYRRSVLHQVDNFAVRHFWEAEYTAFSHSQRVQTVLPLLNKIGPLLVYPQIRNCIGQARSTIHPRTVMDQGGNLLVRAPAGAVGDDVSYLMGGLLVTRLQLAAMSRVDLPPTQRRLFVLVCDEFQNYLSSSFNRLVTEARAMSVGVCAINQFSEQLSRELALTLERNVAVRLSCYLEGNAYRVRYQQLQDASAEDIVVVPDPPLQGGHPELANQIRHYSRQRYGRPRLEVEQAIRTRRLAQVEAGDRQRGLPVWDENPQDPDFWENLVIRERGAA